MGVESMVLQENIPGDEPVCPFEAPGQRRCRRSLPPGNEDPEHAGPVHGGYPLRRAARAQDQGQLVQKPFSRDLAQVFIACFDPCRGLRRNVQVELAGQPVRAQYTQWVVRKGRLGNRLEPPFREVRGAVQWIDERPPAVQDVTQAEGHGVDGKIPLAQVRRQ